MQSKAASVAQYLAELPSDRRAAIAAVRKVILDNLDPTFAEGMQYGMICYAVPHSVFPAGYHCDPRQALPFAGLASQKNYMSVYLGSVYGADSPTSTFRADWAKTGKKLDMGKCCIRFKKVDDLALDLIAKLIKSTPAKSYIASYQRALAAMPNQKAARRAAAANAAAKSTPRAKPAAKKKSTARKKVTTKARTR